MLSILNYVNTVDLNINDMSSEYEDREKELREAIELLFYSYRAFTNGPDEILHKKDLNRIHHRILYFVGREPGLSVNDLLGVLQITKQALHMPLRQLVSMQLVSSNKSASDGRIKNLKLTRAGSRLESRLTGTQLLLLENVFSEVGGKSEQAWRKTMRVLAEDVE